MVADLAADAGGEEDAVASHLGFGVVAGGDFRLVGRVGGDLGGLFDGHCGMNVCCVLCALWVWYVRCGIIWWSG